VTDPLERGLEQRVAAYGLLLDGGRALVVRADAGTDVEARWFLPGGAVEYGEDPVDTVRREFLEETGLVVSVGDVVGVWSEMIEAETRGVEVHSVCIVFAVESWSGEVRESGDGERVSWQSVGEDDDARLDFVRAALRGHLDR
jgi:8-oxo-dGTP diphosphatase